jgi:hypothetical protein
MGVHSRHDEALAFECRIDDAPWASCTDPFEVPVLPPGSHTAEVRGIDRGGAVQAIPELFAWRWGASLGGNYWLHPQTGSTGDTVVNFTVDSPDGALAMRISNRRTLDAGGRLAAAREISPPPTLGPWTPWDVTDPAYGGTPGDGRKLVWLQWQLADGSWTIPDLASTILDRSAPTVTLKLEDGRPFVDEDQLLAVVKANEHVQVCLGDTPEAITAWDCSGTTARPVDDGLGLIAWPVGDVPAGTVATRRLYAAAHDAAGNWSPVVEASITIDRTEPVARLLPVAFVRGSRVSSVSVAVRIRGSATDTGSGVRSVSVQEIAGGTTRTVGSATADAVAVERRVPFAASRTWRARGVDRLGHVGTWATGELVRPVRRDDGSATITYRGSWARVADGSALGNAVHRSRRAGATASVTFTGRAVAIVAPQGPGLGKAEVLVDGVHVATIDTRAKSHHSREIVFARSWSTAGTHTVTLRVRGTAGRPAVSLDGFVFVP